MPTTWRCSSQTITRLMRFFFMISRTPCRVSCGPTVMTCSTMRSETLPVGSGICTGCVNMASRVCHSEWVGWCAGRPMARSRSASVTTPTRRLSSSTTGRPLMRCVTSRCAASASEQSFFTVTTFRLMIRSTSPLSATRRRAYFSARVFNSSRSSRVTSTKVPISFSALAKSSRLTRLSASLLIAVFLCRVRRPAPVSIRSRIRPQLRAGRHHMPQHVYRYSDAAPRLAFPGGTAMLGANTRRTARVSAHLRGIRLCRTTIRLLVAYRPRPFRRC